MSNVQQKYSTTAKDNIKLGKLSLEENKTRFRDINDLFRQLMADIRQESNEARSLISTASSRAASAEAAVTGVRGEVNEANARINTFQSQITAARQTAENAENRAEQAATSASNAATSAATAASSLTTLNTTVTGLQNTTTSLSNRVTTLENAAAENSGISLVDGTTVEYLNGDLTAVDVAIDGDLTDLASDRGQIGRTSIQTGVDLSTIITDGWYAVGGENAAGMPTGVTSGVCRVSSGYAENSVVQCFFAYGDDVCRAFVRSTVDGGTTWTDWKEQISINSLGNGLTEENGVVSVDFSDVLPEVEEEDAGKVLSADGAWVTRVTPEELEAVENSLVQIAEAIENLNTSLEAVQATVAVEPDGTTIAVTDGSLSVPLYLGATEEEDGIAGLVPAAESADADKYLRGDGTWADPAMETSNFDGESAGLVPAPDEDEEGYLKSDGTWADPIEELEPRVEALEEAVPENLAGRIIDIETEIDLALNRQAEEDLDWRTTARAASVSCWPVNGSQIEPTVWFAYTETLPEGTKGPENPSTITGVSSVTVTVGASVNDASAVPHEAEFGEAYYGGHIDVASGLITVTHVAVEPGEELTVDISDNPADSSQFEYVDTFGRTVTTTDGTDLVISGEDAGGLIVYKLAAPLTVQVAGTPCPSVTWTDKHTPKQTFLSSTGTEMQAIYAKAISKTLAEIEARLAALES